jgi:hypothetical protein
MARSSFVDGLRIIEDMTAERLAPPLGQRPLRWTLALLVAVLAVAGAVWVGLRHHHVSLPYHGAAAARFLKQRAGGNDQITQAHCSQSACTVWLKPIPAGSPVARSRMAQNLAVDASVVGNLQAPGGAVYARHWRFVLTAVNGVLTANCSHAQITRIGGLMTPSLLPGICQTSWRPT